MDICFLHSANENFPSLKRSFLNGKMSYVASGGSLFGETPEPSEEMDLMVIASDRAHPKVSTAIYDEARKRRCKNIFLDTATPSSDTFLEICSSLLQRGLTVFCPFSHNVVKGAIPVIEASVSGGFLSEAFSSVSISHPKFAVSIERVFCETALPANTESFKNLTQREVTSLINTRLCDVFFSPQMHCKYFLYTHHSDEVRLVLYDDAETISSKIRLAKKYGASCAFFIYREIADILNEIVF